MESPQNFLAQWFCTGKWTRQLICGSATSHVFGPVSNRADFAFDESDVIHFSAIILKLFHNELLPLNIASALLRPSGVICQSDSR